MPGKRSEVGREEGDERRDGEKEERGRRKEGAYLLERGCRIRPLGSRRCGSGPAGRGLKLGGC